MVDWRKKRQETLFELTLGAHILAYLIAITFLISSNPMVGYTFSTSVALLVGTIFPAVIFILLDYHFLQGGYAIQSWNVVKHIGLFAIITVVFASYQGDNLLLFAALFLLPVVLSSITLGKRWGAFFAGAATGSIFLLSWNNTISGNQVVGSFEATLVLGGIFFLLAWFLGGILEVEKETTRHLYSMVNHDTLTGLGSHYYFRKELSHEVEKAHNNRSNLSLVLIDVDYFKIYNDHYGHIQGDKLLQEIAKLLKDNTPSHAILARYSGDEFAIILPDTGLQEANAVAHALNQVVANHDFASVTNEPYDKITVSAGVATYPGHAQNVMELVDAADEALYNSKSIGRNRVRNYHAVIEQLSKMAGESDQELINSLCTLMTVINGKDRYTYGHSTRVSYYAKLLGEKLGVASQELRLLEFGAFLHDLGKIEIPHEVLNKKEPLTTREWEMMRQHPVWGAEMLKPLDLMEPMIPMIYYHHENYDGSGYPDGLVGENIPLFARVLRVVDSYDAITTSRPYRMLLSQEKALENISFYSGIYYDPLVVDLFVELIKRERSAKNMVYNNSFIRI